MYNARTGKIEDIDEVTAIYRDAFPNHSRSILGHKTCVAYFRAVCSHPSYYLAVSIKNGRYVAGFAVLHFDRRSSLENKWLFADPLAILRFVVRNPIYCANRLIYKAGGMIRKQKVSLKRQITMKSVPTFSLRETGYIDIIAVDQASKKMGVGKILISHCVEVATEKGLRFINLTVDANNRQAIEFYDKLNFSVVLYNPSSESYVLSLPLRTEES